MRSDRSLALRLADILKAAGSARRAVGDLSIEEFRLDDLRGLAAERGLEIVSEASRYIPDPMKSEYPDLPWRRIADLGNVLRHAYHRVDPDTIWKLVHDDLSPLVAAVIKLAERIPPEE